MKRIFVFLVAFLLCFSVITTAYAAVVPFDNTQWLELPSGFGGGSHVYPQSTVVSYSTLQSIRSQVNTWLAQGQYAGFRGTAVLAYNGVYYIQLVQNGVSYRLCNNTGGLYRTESQYDDTSTTTVPSTTAPSTSKTETTEKDTTTVYDPTSPSDSRTELDALNRLIDFTFSQIKAINGLRRTNLNQYNLMIKMRSLMWNMIDGINDMLDLAQDQVDLLTAYFPRLDDIYNQLISVQSASWASLDMESRVFSAVSSIDSRLDSVINNGAVQVNSYTQQADIINAINNIPPYDDSAVVAAIANLETTLSKPSATVTADLTEVTSRLDTLIENSASKVENVTVDITEDNDAFNVFYVTTDGDNKKPVGEVAGDTLSASGKLLNFLYGLCFEGALSKAGESIDTMNGFYFDTGAGTEGNVWD